MQLLIIGAGAVGTVLATVLGRTHDVCLGSRRGSAQIPSAHPISRLPVGNRTTGPGPRTLPTLALDEVGGEPWDAVVLTGAVSDTEEIVARISARPATVFCTVSQVPREIRHLQALVGADRVVVIAPGFLAVRGDESAGTGYWTPPMGPLVTVSGHDADSVRSWFTRAGARTQVRDLRDVLAQAALMMPFMAELTNHGGDWNRLSRNPARALAGAREARAALGTPLRRVPPAWTVGLALRVLPALVPFDFRAYAAEHFARQRHQTEALLEDWIDAGPMPTPALTSLLTESRAAA